MTAKNCNSCDFSEDGRTDGMTVVCKRYPPSVFPIPIGSGVIGGNNGIGQLLVWPVVKRNEWCGEWVNDGDGLIE